MQILFYNNFGTNFSIFLQNKTDKIVFLIKKIINLKYFFSTMYYYNQPLTPQKQMLIKYNCTTLLLLLITLNRLMFTTKYSYICRLTPTKNQTSILKTRFLFFLNCSIYAECCKKCTELFYLVSFNDGITNCEICSISIL